MRTIILFSIPFVFCFLSLYDKTPMDREQMLKYSNRISVDSCFKVNEDLWSLQMSYIATVGDSTDLELILFANNTETTAWNSRKYIGTICSSFKPLLQQRITYVEPTRTWLISIHSDGKSFIELQHGEVPIGNPQVVAIKTRYKLN